ncbi:MAG: ion transporter [Candidatus Sumerlaeaceae bacterium]|nr:ion transporter [Candidatus Sumerlaeaceae bacterium]
MQDKCRAIVQSLYFQTVVMAVIVLNAVVIGIETNPEVMKRFGGLLSGLNVAVQTLFVMEILLRIGSHGRRPLAFFREGWNVFDFAVVALSLLPIAGPFANVARLARILRVVRLVSVSSDLRLIVNTMLRSIPSMAHVVILLAMLIYVYAVLGFYLFGPDDPRHWGTLTTALLSCFQLLTLEGWVEMQMAVIATHPLAWLYFGSFIVVAVFVVVNLFIAVVLNNLDQAKLEAKNAEILAHPQHDLLQIVVSMKAELEKIEETLRQNTRN